MMSNRKMTVALFSNYLMHHQLPFCLEMVRLLGENYIFVATEEFDRERKTLGYEDMNSKYGFVLRA
ncbi:MAG: hypothetical protein J6T73_00390, partial [Clostridia bacterium]|nr:hypothetical protein [Clostridia bacterium]